MISVSTIDALLRAEDIEGLLELGAPTNEYSHEAARIRSALEALTPSREDQVFALIVNVWKHAFGLSEDDVEKRTPAFRRVAQQILESCSQSAKHS